MQGLGAVDEPQLGERHDAVPVERGLEREVEAGERLDGGEPRHLESHLDAAVLARGELIGEQRSMASRAFISPRSIRRTVASRISMARGIFKPTRLRLMWSTTEGMISACAVIASSLGWRGGGRRPRGDKGLR